MCFNRVINVGFEAVLVTAVFDTLVVFIVVLFMIGGVVVLGNVEGAPNLVAVVFVADVVFLLLVVTTDFFIEVFLVFLVVVGVVINADTIFLVFWLYVFLLTSFCDSSFLRSFEI